MDFIDELFNSESGQIGQIESLLNTTNLSYERADEIYRELKGYISNERADELIAELLNNQVDKITAGLNYGQTEIKNKIRREIL